MPDVEARLLGPSSFSNSIAAARGMIPIATVSRWSFDRKPLISFGTYAQIEKLLGDSIEFVMNEA